MAWRSGLARRMALLLAMATAAGGCSLFDPPAPTPQPVDGLPLPPLVGGPSTVPGAEPPAPGPTDLTPPAVDGPLVPPSASINGVEGVIVSFCWNNGCADGVAPTPDALPAVGAPLELALPEGASVAGVTAWNGVQLNPRSLEVGFEGDSIGELPDGTAMLSVFVTFAGGGDASYFWAYEAAP